MKLTSFLPALIIALLLGGCASDRNITPMLTGMTHINQAMQAFGPPDKYMALPDGKTTYIWELNESSYSPPMVVSTVYPAVYGGYGYYRPYRYGYGYPYRGYYGGPYVGWGVGSTVVPGSVYNYYCSLKILANPDGSIVTNSHEGNACDRLILNPDVPLAPPVATPPPVFEPEPAPLKAPPAKAPKKVSP